MRIKAFIICVVAIKIACGQQKTNEVNMFMGNYNAGNCIVGPRLPMVPVIHRPTLRMAAMAILLPYCMNA